MSREKSPLDLHGVSRRINALGCPDPALRVGTTLELAKCIDDPSTAFTVDWSARARPVLSQGFADSPSSLLASGVRTKRWINLSRQPLHVFCYTGWRFRNVCADLDDPASCVG